ncbi:MAG: sigma-70 family RNA polymerase sigma factor [Burkholderiales bacterium]
MRQPTARPVDPAQNQRLAGLLAACARRERDAFAQLYAATAPKLFGVAVRILRREDWAEEVLQDCYVSIWNNAGAYAPGLSAPLTWMTSIVRNRCLDWLRRPNLEVVLQRPDDDGDDPLEAIAADGPGPLEQLAHAADARALAACLAQLDAKQRQAIVLAFYDGLSHSELASHMRQPLGTVKTWVRRGLERLKGCLGGP